MTDGYSGSSSKNSYVSEPERKPRPVAPPPPRRESPSPAKPSRPIPVQTLSKCILVSMLNVSSVFDYGHEFDMGVITEGEGAQGN